MDEIRLPAKKGGRLQHIDHAGHGRNIFDRMHIGQDRHAYLALHFSEDAQAFVEAEPTNGLARAAVGLVVGRLEDVGHAQAGADFLHPAGDVDAQLLGFCRAGSGDQEDRLAQAGLEAAQPHLPLACWLASAALT